MTPDKLLDPRVAAWQRSVQSTGCALDARPLSQSAPSPSNSCADIGLRVRVTGGDLAVVATKLGEFLRILHAATAQPVRLPGYDWLQQLLWPNVCTLPKCQYCYDGDRQVTLQLSCATSDSEPLPPVITAALFDWSEEAASAEYHQLIAAIRATSRDASPEHPLRLTVEVLSASFRITDATEFLQSTRILVQRLAVNDSDWFHVRALLAPFVHAAADVCESVFAMLTTSNLPLVLPELMPRSQSCDTSVSEWLFGPRESSGATSQLMPVLLNLQMLCVGDPSARVFTQFCEWLSHNGCLKSLSVRIPTSLAASHVLEDLGFALFSPLSKLKLDFLEVDIRGITASNIDSMVSGSQRVRHGSEQVSHHHVKHEKLKLITTRLPSALQVKFIRHFGSAARSLLVDVYGGQHRQVLHAILESSPALENLEMTLWHSQPNESPASEDASAHAIQTSAPKLRSLAVLDVISDAGLEVISQTVQLTGSTLSSINIYGVAATATLAENILASCPALETLAVASGVEAGFWERLSDGYSSGRCKISNLTVGEKTRRPSPWVFDMVQKLANTASPLARTLRRLQFTADYVSTELAVLEYMQMQMLETNPFLVELVIPFCAQQLDAARGKNGEVVANVAYPLHSRQRFALLSCTSKIAKGMVPRDVWQLVLEFSSRPARRSVVMRM